MNLSTGLPRMLQSDLFLFGEIWERVTFSSTSGPPGQGIILSKWHALEKPARRAPWETTGGNTCLFTKEGSSV